MLVNLFATFCLIYMLIHTIYYLKKLLYKLSITTLTRKNLVVRLNSKLLILNLKDIFLIHYIIWVNFWTTTFIRDKSI